MALRILIVILILAVPLELPGCGPFLPQALFYIAAQPESPAEFTRGRLGILQPTYERLYQVIAYRYLAGVSLNPGEQKAVQPPPPIDMNAPAPTEAPNPWLVARNQTAGIKALNQLDPFRQVQKRGYFDTYLNCNDDAFRTAASTLERIRPTGAAADWINAQDVVFANCSKGSAIPQTTSDPRLLPDRNYQIASAKFYAEQYDAARKDFQAIATDSSSPWRGLAPYMAARCLARGGKFAEAENALHAIASDPALSRWHPAAVALLGYVGARLHPAERMHELALALVKPDSEKTIGQDLIDYRLLFDRNVKPQPDDLTDWIHSFQSGGAGALETWRSHRTLPWLVAALQSAKPHDSAVPELLAAAAEVKPDSAGYLTVNHHRLRLMQPTEARLLADQLLAGNISTASRNQLRAERMRLALDFDDFLRFAPRRPVAEVTDEVNAVDRPEDYLDTDAALVFNNQLPLSLLKQASASTILPDHVRNELQHVISVRALLLSHAPAFDQVFALLKAPGDRPTVGAGYGRYTKEIEKIDPFRDNWWCSQGRFDARPPEGASFLSAADRTQAAAEITRLQDIASGPDWLAAQTIAFAQRHQQDPRIPEALALAVRATRFGCADPQTGDLSKQAFDLLHSRYPNTEWAKKTPYWYK